MASIPADALEDHSHPFWLRFWSRVGQLPKRVDDCLILLKPETCPTATDDSFLWRGGQTRDGYGRVVSGVGGEMRAHHLAWSFYHRDPVPDGCDVTRGPWCKGGKLCLWPGCLVLISSRTMGTNEIARRLIQAYNREVYGDSLP